MPVSESSYVLVKSNYNNGQRDIITIFQADASCLVVMVHAPILCALRSLLLNPCVNRNLLYKFRATLYFCQNYVMV